MSDDGKFTYQIGIIDYLQTFDSGKKREVIAKKLFKRADPKKLSAVSEEPYCERFVGFMKNNVFMGDKKDQDNNKIDLGAIRKETQ